MLDWKVHVYSGVAARATAGCVTAFADAGGGAGPTVRLAGACCLFMVMPQAADWLSVLSLFPDEMRGSEFSRSDCTPLYMFRLVYFLRRISFDSESGSEIQLGASYLFTMTAPSVKGFYPNHRNHVQNYHREDRYRIDRPESSPGAAWEAWRQHGAHCIVGHS